MSNRPTEIASSDVKAERPKLVVKPAVSDALDAAITEAEQKSRA
jgi:hypothetical protein